MPISQEPESGKFSFEPNSVKSFTVLDKPVFPTLPLLKVYQLQLVDAVLKAQGIGVFPTKQIVGLILLVALAWWGYSYLTAPKLEILQPTEEVNPYQGYIEALQSADPDQEISKF